MEDYTKLNEIIAEFRRKWEIQGNKVWWEEPFKRCFEAGIQQGRTQQKIEDIEEFSKFTKRLKDELNCNTWDIDFTRFSNMTVKEVSDIIDNLAQELKSQLEKEKNESNK